LAKAVLDPEDAAVSHHLKTMTMMRRKDHSVRPGQRPGRRLYVNRLKEGGMSRILPDALDISSTVIRHQIFTGGSSPVLAPVAVADRGDAKFSAALACWRRLCSDYEPSETVRIRLLGYAFSGVAATLFQEVKGETKQGITAEEVWTLMAANLYNDDMIATQRAKFNAASLEAGEDVSELAKPLYELALGLPVLQGSSRSILLMQRLKDVLPSELRTHMATIRNTHSFDAAAAVLSQIQREKGIEGGRGRRREPVRAVTEGSVDSVAAAMPENVQAIESLVPTVSQQQHPGRAPLSITIDKTAPVGSRMNPVGPDPERPGDRNMACSSR
jgi:hypothetical protein